MTVLYKALFDFETDKEDELPLSLDEGIFITNQDSPDWWLAERIDHKAFGLVPSNFLEKVKPDGNTLAVVLENYAPQGQDELSLSKFKIITVLEQHGKDGFWKGEASGKTGPFPTNYVQVVDENGHLDEIKAKNGFKLAAYGVKQGGIGSILAGGFSPLKRNSRTSVNTNDVAPPPTIPAKPNAPLPNPESNTAKNQRAMVTHDYTPENDDEIKLMRGEYVVNIDQLDNAGWWKGTSESGGTGIFPSNFVQLVETEEKAPQRPPRARPATVKSENSPPSSLASPPPVPVTTRPTSLLTSRQASSNSSSGVPVVAPPRPTTTPPRPTTSPPVPTSMTNSPPVPTRRLNNMTISTDSKNSSHKRTPSIPLVSPDLPPMSPGFERPTRTLPTRPTSVNDTSPTDKPGPHHLAKPPKVNFGNKSTPLNPTAPPRHNTSTTITSPNVIPSAIPEKKPENPPTAPKRSMPPVPETEDGLDPKIQKLIQIQIEKVRKEFELQLQQERLERMKLEMEIQELKNQLQ